MHLPVVRYHHFTRETGKVAFGALKTAMIMLRFQVNLKVEKIIEKTHAWVAVPDLKVIMNFLHMSLQLFTV